MEDILFGTFTNFNIAPALTASGGETMPPNKKPSAREKPGIIKLEPNATEIAVRKTTPNAKLPIIRRQRHNSFHDIDQAASYNNGGRKIIKIISGSMCIVGVPGKTLINKPANTSNIGYATFILLASTINKTMATISDR